MVATLGRQRRPRPSDETRRVVLDAAEQCFTRYGIQQTTIEDIVRVAGVPRATLYRHAGSRDELLVAVALRELDRVLAELDLTAAADASPAQVIVDALLQSVALVEASPLLRALIVSTPPLVNQEMGQEAIDGVLGRLGTFLEPVLTAGQAVGLLRAELTVPLAQEHALRTIHSQLTFAVHRNQTESERRAYLEQSLVRFFL